VQPYPLPASRNIFTSKVAADGSLSLVPFTSSGGNFSAADLLALNTDPHTGTVDNFANDRISFLRGDRSQEQSKDAAGNVTGKFRVRDSVLGDIINSAPVYYGAPQKIFQVLDILNFTKHMSIARKQYMSARMTECCMHLMLLMVMNCLLMFQTP
jgi:type IV pilus assembly protein PilY1